MKKFLIAIAMVLTLSMNVDAAAQKHRHTPRTEQVDSTKNNHDAIEAFSDTTAVDSAAWDEDDYYRHSRSISDEDVKAIRDIMEGVGGIVMPGAAIAIVTIVVLFLLAPLLIIIVIFYFVNRNRKEKYKLAQMAIQNGQPIPEQLLNEKPDEWDKDDYKSGIRQLFLGIGLMIFLGYTAGKIGFAIGALVFCIGLGKVVIAKTTGEKNGSIREIKDNSDNWDNNNN